MRKLMEQLDCAEIELGSFPVRQLTDVVRAARAEKRWQMERVEIVNKSAIPVDLRRAQILCEQAYIRGYAQVARMDPAAQIAAAVNRGMTDPAAIRALLDRNLHVRTLVTVERVSAKVVRHQRANDSHTQKQVRASDATTRADMAVHRAHERTKLGAADILQVPGLTRKERKRLRDAVRAAKHRLSDR